MDLLGPRGARFISVGIVFVIMPLVIIQRPPANRCIADLPDECSQDNGKCWQADIRVSGAAHHFTACRDNIVDYKRALAEGSEKVPPLHTCVCPACFQATSSGGCEPKCDLRYCDPALGACLVPRGKGEVGKELVCMVGR